MDRLAFLTGAAVGLVAPRSLLGGTPVALVTADLESRVVAYELPGLRRLRAIPIVELPRDRAGRQRRARRAQRAGRSHADRRRDPDRPEGAARFPGAAEGTGTFRDAIRSPDGRWLAFVWAEVDQLVFVTAAGPRRVEATADLTGQFDGTATPRLAGWCPAAE